MRRRAAIPGHLRRDAPIAVPPDRRSRHDQQPDRLQIRGDHDGVVFGGDAEHLLIVKSTFNVDPNTGAAWTPAGRAAAQFGYKNP